MTKTRGIRLAIKLISLVFSMSLVSCTSLNSHQTGRTVGKGNASGFGNFNFGYIDLT